MRGRKKVILLTLGFLIGVSIMLYPAISNYWNAKFQTRAVVEYEDVLETVDAEDYEKLLKKAHAYNKALYESKLQFHYYKEISGYDELLRVEGSSVIGYVNVDKIGVELPIYHGTSELVLSNGVGHLEGSSLPVGGENTHCVLSAHRGLVGSKLFTDLDRMELGDTFELSVLDQVLTYQVDQIEVVTPEELDNLLIEPGKDYCTLFTCTPYGINTHRLLVRGVRIETITGKQIYVANEAFRIEPMLVTPAVAAPMILIFLIYLMVKYRQPANVPQETKKKKKNKKEKIKK